MLPSELIAADTHFGETKVIGVADQVAPELVEKYGMIILDQKNIKISDGNDGWIGVDTITIFQKTNKISDN